jgi:hypothetical protein
MVNSTLGKILATGLFALEDALQAFSNPTTNTAPAVDNFISEVLAIWGKKAATPPTPPAS